MKKSKYIILTIIIGLIALVVLLTKSSDKEFVYKFKNGEEINIFITSDTHYLAESIRDNGEAFNYYYENGDGKQLNYIPEIMDSFIDEIKGANPDILVISGDLTNNGEYKSHLELIEKLNKIEELGTEIYVIPGNHDIENPYARGFSEDKQYKVDSISRWDFEELYREFGYEEAVSKDKDSLSYLVTPSEDLWLLMLDTNITENNLSQGYPETSGRLKKESINWIKKVLELAEKKGAKVIPVMHHNLTNHNEVISNGFTIKDNTSLLDLFTQYDTDIVFSGHIHIQDIAASKVNNNEIYDVASNALSVYPNQYGVLKYSINDGYTYSTKDVDVESWAKVNGKDNNDLINFEEYSKEFFGRVGTIRPYTELINEGFSEKDANEGIEALKELNIMYFAGRQNEITEEIKKTKGYEILQRSEGFMKEYSNVISKDLNIGDNNSLKIDK